ncbi:multidrug efflux SMR transporter [Paenibacillus sp. IB182496]|uniref:Multidrug efflux SMR transporter n=1 Tax=Paenibacillus sabuli TaxID=2772509 RepID=A0A927BNP4_9BACL|nr:multidrug efflux SMR transporter [Paenibacillus sabuli]MBD2843897.1 multidrug efflux SMR transporter [Paenibacillus sabuli]
MSWLWLMLAGLCEMAGVLLLGRIARRRTWRDVGLLALAFGCSFTLLSLAMRTIPMATAYAIWTGIGAAGGVTLGMLLFGEPRSWQRVGLLAVVLGAAIGLKLTG